MLFIRPVFVEGEAILEKLPLRLKISLKRNSNGLAESLVYCVDGNRERR
jgi:hypothetical protein